MTKKAERLRRRWNELWNAKTVTCSEMQRFATSLGRKRRRRSGRGGGRHEIWESRFSSVRAVPIPSHSGDLKIGTKQSLLKAFEEDVMMWEHQEDTNGF